MTTTLQRPPSPSDRDARDKLLDAALRKHGRDRHALIEVLHTAQELFGCLPKEILRYVSRALDLPESRVYGVATFYHFFSLIPKGRHSCIVCIGTACYVKRSADIVATLGKAFGIRPEQITPDGALSLSVARCVGSCAIAPLVVLDGQVRGNLTAESAVQLVHSALTKNGGASERRTSGTVVGGSEAAP
jgi:bidirectional [NiFe] hydrogenase diaphorase subunit